MAAVAVPVAREGQAAPVRAVMAAAGAAAAVPVVPEAAPVAVAPVPVLASAGVVWESASASDRAAQGAVQGDPVVAAPALARGAAVRALEGAAALAPEGMGARVLEVVVVQVPEGAAAARVPALVLGQAARELVPAAPGAAGRAVAPEQAPERALELERGLVLAARALVRGQVPEPEAADRV
jgi:hypothetical protein